MSVQVYAPNIHLFAFYQKEKLDENGNLVIDKADWLWEKGDEIIRRTLHKSIKLKQLIDPDINPDMSYIELASSKFKKQDDSEYEELLTSKIQLDEYSGIFIHDDKIYFDNGDYLFAIRGYKSYGLGINLLRPILLEDNKLDVEKLQELNPDNCFILEENERFLGQTLLITAKLTQEDRDKDLKTLKKIADEYLESFFTDAYEAPPFNQAGTLFDSPIFEYGIFRQLTTYCHVLVWFITDDEAENKFNACYKEIFDLFCFRAEVINAYQKSYKDAKVANQLYKDVRREIKKIYNVDDKPGLSESELKEFNEILITLPRISLKYADIVRRIDEYQNSILVNTRNYNDKLQEINTILPYEDTNFLAIFSDKTSRYFQEELATDITYFHDGFSLVDKALGSIRGQVAIDQREREGRLEINIFAVGSGVGAASIVSSGYEKISEKPITSFPMFPILHRKIGNPYLEVVGESILFGVFVSAVVWIFFGVAPRMWQDWQDARKK